MALSDKEMAVIFKFDAGEYMVACADLGTDKDSLRLVAPTNFMRSHAIELLLKAFLLARGWSLKRCKDELGHDLCGAMKKAEEAGLVLTNETKGVIQTLSPLHLDYTFRYRPQNPYSFPNATMATRAVDELFGQVHSIVTAECLGDRSTSQCTNEKETHC
jgi:hypothetical protein